MATTASGTPYVESSDLVANYPAVSEALAERVDEVGVIPFSDSTARGTAIPSPTEGQYTYLQDTNATEYWDGSAWVAAGVAPGLVHINTTTFSAVSSVSLDDVFTSDYENYLILCSFVPTTSGDMFVRLRVGGTDNTTASSYLSQRLTASSTTITGARNTTNQWYAFQGGSARTNNYQMNVYSPQLAVTTGFESSVTRTDGGAYLASYTGDHQVASAFDGFTSLFGSNTAGTIRVYGYSNGA